MLSLVMYCFLFTIRLPPIDRYQSLAQSPQALSVGQVLIQESAHIDEPGAPSFLAARGFAVRR